MEETIARRQGMRRLNTLVNYHVVAKDGETGKVENFYFDDSLWTVRYMIVNTGGWLLKNLVLLSPVQLTSINDEEKAIHVDLTKEQIENSPDVYTHKPVSRQMEMELSAYYGMGYYWDGFNTWGMVPLPVDLRGRSTPGSSENKSEKEDSAYEDSHLRSMKEISGYHVQLKDDEMGHLEDIVVNRDTWAIDYFIMNTGNIIPGKNIEFSIKWVSDISYREGKIFVNLTRKELESVLKA